MDFGLLGPLLVRDGARQVAVSAPRQRVLLATLLLSAGRVVSVDALAEMVWDGRPPAGARGALHSAIQRLRTTLGPSGAALIGTRPPGYVLQVGDGEFDVRQFGVLAARGHAAAEAGAWAAAARLWREALGLWRGEALADVPSQLLRAREVPPLADQRLAVLGARIDADLRLGRHGELVAELRQLVAAHPLREHFHAQLMLSLYRGGRQGEALAAYLDVRQLLAGELGVDPGPELQRLHQRILAADPGLLPAPGAQPGGEATALSPPAPGAPVTPGGPGVPKMPGEPGEPATPGGPGVPRMPGEPGGAATPGGPAEPRMPGELVSPAAGALGAARERIVPRQLPVATRHFAGRADALEALAGLAAEAGGTSRAVVISAIEGTAGVGKTTLAVHFAHQVAGRFPDGQLYVNLRGFDPAAPPMPPGEAIQIFLEALGVRPARIPAGLESRAGLYRSLLAGRRMLVLLDNAADADQVRPLLPGSPGCLVLVTSRNQLTGLVATEGAYPLTLDLLTAAEAHEMLTRRLGADRLGGGPDDEQLGGDRPGSEAAAAGELIELCARLPLALAIAAARAAAQPRLPLASLAADLRDAGGRLDALDAGHGAANVRAVLAASYRQLDPAAARLLRLLGLHPGPDISAPAAASLAALPPRQARHTLAELTRAHLLAEPSPGRFTFHDLLRAYAAERAQTDDSEAGRRAAIHRMLDHYLFTAHDATILLQPFGSPPTLPARQAGVEPERPEDPGQALAWFGAERRVLMAAAAQALEAGFNTHAWQIPWAMGRYLDLQGYWNDWAIAEQAALAAAERLGDRGAQAGAHLRMGFARGRLGNYQEAYAQLEQALSIYTELGDRSGQGDAENALTLILQIEGRDAEALGHAERALAIYVAIGDRFRQATALNAVGWFHSQLGDHQRALGYCEQALELLQGLGSHQAEAGTWDSLGYIHHHLGDHALSAACYQRALELFREIGDRWGQATTLDHVGDAHHAAGHQEQARAVWEESLAILDDIHHPEAGQVRAKLAGLGADPRT